MPALHWREQRLQGSLASGEADLQVWAALRGPSLVQALASLLWGSALSRRALLLLFSHYVLLFVTPGLQHARRALPRATKEKVTSFEQRD